MDRHFQASEILSTDAEPDEPLTTEAEGTAVPRMTLTACKAHLAPSFKTGLQTPSKHEKLRMPSLFSLGADCSFSIGNQAFIHASPTSQRRAVLLSRLRQGLGHLYFVRAAGATGAECKVFRRAPEQAASCRSPSAFHTDSAPVRLEL